MESKKIDSKIPIEYILQFCKENNLNESFKKVIEETKTEYKYFNSIEEKKEFETEFLNGEWDKILKKLNFLTLSKSNLFELEKMIIEELIEYNEIDVAKLFFLNSNLINYLKENEEEKKKILEIEKLFMMANEKSMNIKKEDILEKRENLLKKILFEIKILKSNSFLLSMDDKKRKLIQTETQIQSIQNQINIDQNIENDSMKQMESSKKMKIIQEKEENKKIKMIQKIKFGKKSYPTCSIFSPNDKYLVSGSFDNFIEVWNYKEGKLNLNLEYQLKDEFMIHESKILCLDFSYNSEILLSGSEDGMIKIWNIKKGNCIRKIKNAHEKGISSLKISKNLNYILSCSFDKKIKIHGLNSGNLLKEFIGHESFINEIHFIKNDEEILSCSSDSTIRIWNVNSTECILNFNLNNLSILSCKFIENLNQILISNHSKFIHLFDKNGKLLKIFTHEKSEGDFILISISFDLKYLYGITDDNILFTFDFNTSLLLDQIQIHKKNILHLNCHPFKNILSTSSIDGYLKIWSLDDDFDEIEE
eukprot:gene2877-4720_t